MLVKSVGIGWGLGLLAAVAGAEVTTGQGVLLGADTQSLEGFGERVDVDGDTAIVGARSSDSPQLQSGAAYVFVRSGTSWSQEAKLVPVDAEANKFFGSDVGVSGDFAVVGARGDDHAGLRSGAAYVFQRSGTTWAQVAKLTDPVVAESNDQFGHSVAIDGHTLVVGAQGDRVNGGINTGRVSVYAYDGASWSLQAALVAEPPTGRALFGSSLDLQGDLLLVGAEQNDDLADAAGSAYVFARGGTSWTQEARLLASDGEEFDRFGASVALSGDTALIGAYGNEVSGSNDGAAYVFERQGTTWSERAQLVPSVPSFLFGWAVALVGDVAVVSTYGDEEGGIRAGAAWVFARAGGTWSEQQKIFVPVGYSFNDLGWTVDLDGATLAVGVPKADTSGANEGEVLLYEIGVTPATYCAGKTSSLGCVPFLSASGVPSASSTSPFAIQAAELLPDEVGYLVYGFGKANLSFHGGKLCVKSPFSRWLPPKAALNSGDPPCTGVISRNFNARIQSGVDPQLTPGQRVFAQLSQRDPADPTGFGDTLTDGVRFEICP